MPSCPLGGRLGRGFSPGAGSRVQGAGVEGAGVESWG